MVSTLSGPIPPHPYYDKSEAKTFLNLPQPRVRPEAENYAKQGQGSLGNLLQIEGQRPPSALQNYRKTKVESKDHMKQNVQKMRQISRAAKQRENETKQPVKAMWKSSKYEGVQSKVKENLKTDDSCHLNITGLKLDVEQDLDAPRPHSGNFLRAHSRTGWNPVTRSRPGSASSRPGSVEPPDEKMTVPRAHSAREVRMSRREIDFVKANGMAVKHVGMKRAPSLTSLDDLKKKQEEEQQKYRKGQVPKYLQNRQREWQQEEEDRIASIPDPDMPPGHRLMLDDERLDTLKKLKQTEKELMSQLGHMPIRSDTPRIRRTKEGIEKKLSEIDEAIKIFSRTKVFVKMNQ